MPGLIEEGAAANGCFHRLLRGKKKMGNDDLCNHCLASFSEMNDFIMSNCTLKNWPFITEDKEENFDIHNTGLLFVKRLKISFVPFVCKERLYLYRDVEFH